MAKEQFDIVVSGGGLAGLTAAAAFGHAGYSVLLLDPAPPAKPNEVDTSDLRSTAYLQPARYLLKEIGLWSSVADFAVPLETLRIVDCIGEPPKLREERAFQAAELGDAALGWNLLNWLTVQKFRSYLAKQPNVEMRLGQGFSGLLARTSAAIVTLTDGSQVSTKLVIGADGRDSTVRKSVGIGVKTTRYGQKSLAFTASHTRPHNNVSTEIYHLGGPFTVVPLADVKGQSASAIVWMNDGRRSLELAQMPVKEFNVEMNRRSAGLFGPMELISQRAVWPIVTQLADKLATERTALVAEAAHVLPPIGAQGLNTSLNDISALLHAAKAFPDALGERQMLDSYAHARLPDIKKRAKAIDLFNRVTRSGATGPQTLRLFGLKAAHDIAPIRQALMRAGMGPT
ncbi:MAG: FAD-dependent monooxygenase [Paracoccaceae bacterium]